MQLGTRVKYGMVAVLDLARRAQPEPVRAADIASATGISRGYLEGLLAVLRRAGIVTAIRGPGGGWRLARRPGRLRPGEIYAALEGSTALVQCVTDRDSCRDASRCGARKLWVRMTRALDAALRRDTVAQLAGIAPRRRRIARDTKASPAAQPRKGLKTRAKARARVLKRARIRLVKKQRRRRRVTRAVSSRLRKSA